MTDEHRRAAQIAAVRDVMDWTVNPEDPYEENIADLAAEIVDAVMAVPLSDECAVDGGRPGRIKPCRPWIRTKTR